MAKSLVKIFYRTSTPRASTSFPRRDALGEIKDEAEDKFDEDTWFSVDEKRNKMTKASIVELLKEFPLPLPFSARVHALQEPANYGTDLETSVYEGQIRSGYRVPMHPFAVAFFNHYKMAPGQLVPNGWRKLVGLIYLVQTSGGQEANGSSQESGTVSIKIMKRKASWLSTLPQKKLINHIKRRGGLNIDEPLTDQETQHAGLILPTPIMPVPLTPIIESRAVLGHTTQVLAIGTSSSGIPSLEMAVKGEGAKGPFLGLLEKASKGKRKEGVGEGSSPMAKRRHAPTPPVPLLVVEDLPIDKDLIFFPTWTIKRGDLRMPSSHVSAQHLAYEGVA
ncbi:hypothetical protein RJ639_030286 [Escallonia herrerae]|uniref:Transposase (putative) gypsy type domain-containing protein n=1 Tax=Escallonia herrerae TaxID=1293975 RepID=A0AA89BNS2_9ASTE|nr:hypothetical protein RJ639_030286 [Escallonia herrerae]